MTRRILRRRTWITAAVGLGALMLTKLKLLPQEKRDLVAFLRAL